MDHGAILNTLLLELKDGVIVCDAAGTILRFNEAATDLFDRDPRLTTGKSLYAICFQPPIEQALNLLHYQYGLKNQAIPLPYVQFMNRATDRKLFFRCRANFLSPPAEGKGPFVMTFEDISAWQIPDNPLFMKIEEFRAPMTNLRAAVENLTEFPEMSPVMRSAFENVLVQESLNLTEAFNSLTRACRTIVQTQNLLTKINGTLLFGYVKSHLQESGVTVTSTPGRPFTVQVDIYGLLLVLGYLIKTIEQLQEETGLSCEINAGERFIYFDFNWHGPFIPSAAIGKILKKKLTSSVGGMTVAAILHSMDGDIWSQQHENFSTLRLALPIAAEAGTLP